MITIRPAEPKDTVLFANWVAYNPDIPRKDVLSGLKQNNPTSCVEVVEIDGKPILFLPFYAVLNVAYFGFNPEATDLEKGKAMSAMLNAVKAFAAEYNIREIQGFSKREYLMAKWAVKKGFTEEPRQAFVLRLWENGNVL